MAFGAIAAAVLGLRILWVIVQDFVEGNHVVAPGYPEEPAGPDIPRLVIALFFLCVGVLAAWADSDRASPMQLWPTCTTSLNGREPIAFLQASATCIRSAVVNE